MRQISAIEGRGFRGLVGAGALGMALLAGCQDAAPPAAPRTAAQAGRSVIGSDGIQIEKAEPTKAHATDAAPQQQKNTPKPVAAQKPAEKPLKSENGEDAEAMAAVSSQPVREPSRFPGGIVPALPTAQPLPGGPRLLVPENDFKTTGNPPALRVSYDDLDLLKVLNLGSPLPNEVTEMFPGWLKALDGKRIEIRGFMYPAYATQLTGFILTRDMGACCFGPNPRVYYLIPVKLAEGTTTPYIPGRPFDVAGTFHIKPVRDGQGNLVQLWSMTDAKVIQ